MVRCVRLAVVSVALSLCMILPVVAGGLAPPMGPVVLTVDGRIEFTNVGESAGFDREMLNALGLHSLKSTNPWVKGVHEFEGVLLADILRAVGATDGIIEARALDGYTIDLPTRDAFDYSVLLAMKWNGEVMPVRNKGPIWIVYPVDQYPELKNERYSTRSIWQLQQLTVR